MWRSTSSATTSTYSGAEWVDLAGTHSDHHTCLPAQLAGLLAELRRQIDQAGGRVPVHYEATLGRRARRRLTGRSMPRSAWAPLASPRTRSPTMLRWISADPPQMVSDREKKKSDWRLLTG